jgi:RNA polymerase sporulation-specific sigma factor
MWEYLNDNLRYINLPKEGKKMFEYEKMMYFILKKYGLYDKREDYIDICYIGYAKALKKYDSSKSKATTYIYKCIENELLQCLLKENAKKRQREELSLNYIYDERGHDLEDLISSDVDIENDFIEKEQKNKLCEAIKKLSKKEQFIIKYSFGLNCDEKTQNEIGQCLGVTQVQVSRLKDKILIKLKRMMEDENNNISK